MDPIVLPQFCGLDGFMARPLEPQWGENSPLTTFLQGKSFSLRRLQQVAFPNGCRAGAQLALQRSVCPRFSPGSLGSHPVNTFLHLLIGVQWGSQGKKNAQEAWR